MKEGVKVTTFVGRIQFIAVTYQRALLGLPPMCLSNFDENEAKENWMVDSYPQLEGDKYIDYSRQKINSDFLSCFLAAVENTMKFGFSISILVGRRIHDKIRVLSYFYAKKEPINDQ